MSDVTPDSPVRRDSDHRSAPPVRHRPWWIVFIVLGSIFCLVMGYWQLTRYQSASGNVQNLGYTFMWPFLAVFLFYAYFRYIRLEADEAAQSSGGGERSTQSGQELNDDAEDRLDDEVPARGAGRGMVADRTPTAIPEDILPARRRFEPEVEDETLRAYNNYLAELARRDAAEH